MKTLGPKMLLAKTPKTLPLAAKTAEFLCISDRISVVGLRCISNGMSTAELLCIKAESGERRLICASCEVSQVIGI